METISFPFRESSTQFPAVSDLAASIKESIVQIVNVVPGERYMRPDWGCRALGFVFETNDATLDTYMTEELSRAIQQFEPRAKVRQVVVSRENKDDIYDPSVIVTIYYTIPVLGVDTQLSVLF